jgi:hypothetical protein
MGYTDADGRNETEKLPDHIKDLLNNIWETMQDEKKEWERIRRETEERQEKNRKMEKRKIVKDDQTN